MTKPFISLCIPTCKNVEYLQRLLDSIVIQTYKNYEIIITDNSPDKSVDTLVKDFSIKLSINYYKNNPRTNMGENFNRVLQKASGKWIKMMHDDDWFSSPESLQKFADAALNTSGSFIFSAYNNVSLSGKELNKFLTKPKKEMLEHNLLSLFYSNVIGHPSTAMHKKDDTVLYDPQFKWLVDIDFYIRYLLKHPGFEYLDETLINIGVDENQASNKYYKNPTVETPEYFQLLNKHAVKISDNKFVFHAFWLLVRKFKIKDFRQIIDTGYAGFIPEELSSIIRFQKKIPRLIMKQTPFSNHLMQQCFNKINKENKLAAL